MRKWWKGSLALSLGLLTGSIRAEEPVPIVQGERPVIASSNPQRPIASLGRPVPATNNAPALQQPAVLDPQLRPTSYNSNNNWTDLSDPVIRAQAPDSPVLKPMPIGPADTTSTSTPIPTTNATPPATASVWRKCSSTPTLVSNSSESGPIIGGAAGAGVIASTNPFLAPPAAPILAPSATPAITGPAWSMLHGGCWCGDSCSASDGCNPCACDGCCTFDNHFYATADYLLWWIKGSNTPPLVTQGSAGDRIPGALGLPGTSVLFGGGSVEDNPFSGGRFTVGYWFGDQHLLGIELGGFFLGQQGQNFSATSFGSPILTRPFVDAATGTQTTELVSGPGVLAGTVTVNSQSQLWGYETNLRSNLFCGQVCGGDYFIDGLLGFRGLGLDESLNIHESLVVIGGTTATSAAAGEQFAVNDRFAVQNRFYGGQVGATGEYRTGRWVFDLTTKIGLGPTQQMVQIDGSTVITPPNGTAHTYAGGLLAGTSNIGRYTRDEFTWVPELGLNIGYQLTNHVRLFVGYSVLYWSDVVRPGDQIDTTVNTKLLPPAVGGGPARPQFTFNGSDFWAQGVNVGLEFKY